MHNLPPDIYTSIGDRANLTKLVQQHLVSSWHNWILTNGENCEDIDAIASLQILAEQEDAFQDHLDELQNPRPHEPTSLNHSFDEEDPFGSGRMNLDGTSELATSIWTKQSTAVAEIYA